jgi:copper homeostasis protein
MLFEVCVDSIDSALAAVAGGAERLELCQALAEGGLTPSYGLVEACLEQCPVQLMMMIRPRAGDFVYSEAEFEVMKRDIATAKKLGVQGVVFGILRPDQTVDELRNKRLLELARPLSVTFHRAFDLTPEPLPALEILIKLGFDRLLSSGQAASALEGSRVLKALLAKAGKRIKIMAGADIHEDSVADLVRQTGVREIHASASSRLNSRAFGSRFLTSKERVAAILVAARASS